MNKRRTKSNFSDLHSYQQLEPRSMLATLIVDTGVDVENPVPDGKISLREAIIAANTNAPYGDAPAGDADEVDTILIQLPETLQYQWIRLTGPAIEITESVSIEGAPSVNRAFVTSAYNERIFKIESAGQVSIQNLSFSRSSVNDGLGGGAIFSQNTDLYLERVGLNGNRANGQSGGAILIRGGSLTTNNSAFNNNIADRGGSVAIEDGAVWNDFNSRFRWNYSNVEGGAVSVDNSIVDLNRTLFARNWSEGTGDTGGGTLFFTGDSDVDLTFVNIFHGNSEANGGAIYSNSSGSLTLKGTMIQSNWAAKHGGEVYLENGTFEARPYGGIGTRFGGFNTRAGWNGGSLYFENTSARLRDVVVGSSRAGTEGSATHGMGGAIFSIRSNLNVVGKGTGIHGSSYYAGGAIAVIGGSFNMDGGFGVGPDANPNYRFSERRGEMALIRGRVEHMEDSVNNRQRIGGGIYSAGAAVTIRGTIIDSDIHPWENGRGGGVFSVYSNVRIENSIFRENFASTAGGAIFASRGTLLTLRSSLLHDGRSETGGLIFADQAANTYIIQTKFYDGRATNGGAIMNHGRLNIHGSNLTFNRAEESGGAIFNTGDATIYSTRFEDNVASHGGAISLSQADDLIVATSQFVNNRAIWAGGDQPLSSGGAIDGQANFVHLANSQFTGNRAMQGGAISFDGGRIAGRFLQFGGPNVEDGNGLEPDRVHKRSMGGAIYLEGAVNAELTRDRFTNNHAALGGAIAVVANSSGTPQLEISSQTSFASNSAIRHQEAIAARDMLGGGAIANLGGQLDIRDTVFSENFSDRFGGAVVNFGDGSEIQMQEVLFSENESSQLGGAIFNDAELGVFESSFLSNVGGRGFGAMFNSINAQLAMNENQFEGNS